jgi:(2Fe-2S) ferredoxin
MSTRVTVVLTGWKVGLQTIDLMKLLRRYGHIDLRDAKRLVEELVRDRMIGVEVDPNDVAEFVSRARAAGAIIERPD